MKATTPTPEVQRQSTRRRGWWSLGLLALVLLVSGFSGPERTDARRGPPTPGWRSSGGPNPELQQYTRTTFATKKLRIRIYGIDLYNRRLFEEAAEAFRSLKELDPSEVEADRWLARIAERLRNERNEAHKAWLFRTKGSLRDKQTDLNWKQWGPMAGHFEVRISPPRVYIPPPRKIRPRADDAALAKAKTAADSGDSAALFELAMVHKSRKEFGPAVAALVKSTVGNPDILAQDDEGLCADVLTDFESKLEKGNVPPADRLMAAQVSLLQGDHYNAAVNFIAAASRDAAHLNAAREGLRKLILLPNRPAFLNVPPEISFFAHGYSFEGNEDRYHVAVDLYPTTPVFIFPLELPLDPQAIKTTDLGGKDLLMVLPDPQATQSSRLFLIGRDGGDLAPTLALQMTMHIDDKVMTGVDLSTTLPFNLADNWAFIAGGVDTFPTNMPMHSKEESIPGGSLRAWRLATMAGRAPYVHFPAFHKQLAAPAPIDTFINTLRGMSTPPAIVDANAPAPGAAPAGAGSGSDAGANPDEPPHLDLSQGPNVGGTPPAATGAGAGAGSGAGSGTGTANPLDNATVPGK